MRAIIIAAGRGKRMKDLSDDLPKCLLEVNGDTILRHQIKALRSCGIDDIVVIKGYKSECIDYQDVRYRINNDYLNNNILSSLFFAEPDIEGDVLIAYGDILFKPKIIEKLISVKANIAIAVDTSWESRYLDRKEHPISEAENVVVGAENKLIEVGKVLEDKKRANGEFIGMMKINSIGATILKDAFHKSKRLFNDKPFQRASKFEEAYLTDMLQELVDTKNEVDCVCIQGGWAEIDTPEDYIKAQEMFA